MSNIAQMILITIGVAIGSAAGTTIAVKVMAPEPVVQEAPTTGTATPDEAAPTARTGNDLVLRPADYMAAAMACESYRTVGMAAGSDKQKVARETRQKLVTAAIEAAGIDPATCAKF